MFLPPAKSAWNSQLGQLATVKTIQMIGATTKYRRQREFSQQAGQKRQTDRLEVEPRQAVIHRFTACEAVGRRGSTRAAASSEKRCEIEPIRPNMSKWPATRLPNLGRRSVASTTCSFIRFHVGRLAKPSKTERHFVLQDTRELMHRCLTVTAVSCDGSEAANFHPAPGTLQYVL